MLDNINSKSNKDICWNQINPTGEKPGKVSHNGAVMYDGKMIIYGGLHNQVNSEKSLYIFNLETHEWKIKGQKGVKPMPRDEHSTLIYNDYLYVFGGSLIKGAFSNDLWSYSISTEEWKKIETANKPCPRSGHAACILGHSIYIFGGLADDNIRLNDLWECNLDNPEWIEIKCDSAPKVNFLLRQGVTHQ